MHPSLLGSGSMGADEGGVYFETGGPEVFRYEEVPDPVCEPGGMVIDSRFPLAEAAEAHRRIESRLAYGRVLLIL